MSFDEKYFSRFSFSAEQIEKNLASAFRDLEIATSSPEESKSPKKNVKNA
jgi:hypothetical protein